MKKKFKICLKVLLNLSQVDYSLIKIITRFPNSATQ